jgi:hypothetical protein
LATDQQGQTHFQVQILKIMYVQSHWSNIEGSDK